MPSHLTFNVNDSGNDNYQLMHCLFDVCSYGVIVVDYNLRVILWNNWIAERSGILNSTALGQHMPRLFPELKKSRLFNLVDNAFNKGTSGMLSHALNKTPFPLLDPQDTRQKIKHAIYVRPITLSNATRYCRSEEHTSELQSH